MKPSSLCVVNRNPGCVIIRSVDPLVNVNIPGSGNRLT
jgi:hypothetical protein